MSKLAIVCALGLVVGMACSSASASPIHITLPVAWSQSADFGDAATGWLSKEGSGSKVCETDFQLPGTTTDPIGALRWWGYYTNAVPNSQTHSVTFTWTIHWNVPANTTDPYSGETLAYSHPTGTAPSSGIVAQGTGVAYENLIGTSDSGHNIYQYEMNLGTAFDWVSASHSASNPVPNSTIFWVDIAYADTTNPTYNWNWSSATSTSLGKSLQNPDGHYSPWASVTQLSTDTALEIMTTTAAPAVPEPVTLALLGIGAVTALLRRRK